MNDDDGDDDDDDDDVDFVLVSLPMPSILYHQNDIGSAFEPISCFLY